MDTTPLRLQIRAECWYCTKAGYLYRHVSGYIIGICDHCRAAVPTDVEG